jgi:hypothetical protein
MIRVILSHTLVFVVGVAFFAADAISSINNCPNTLSGYWRLDESSSGSYQDYVGTNDGACDGGCPSPTSDGVSGNGQLFDGTNDGIRVPANSIMNWLRSDSFTIELWVQRVTGNTDLEAFVGRADAGGLSWYIGINSSGRAQVRLNAADGSGPSSNLNGKKTSEVLHRILCGIILPWYETHRPIKPYYMLTASGKPSRPTAIIRRISLQMRRR